MGTRYYIKCNKCEKLHPDDGIENKDFFEKVLIYRNELIDLTKSVHDLPNDAHFTSLITIRYGNYPNVEIDWLYEHRDHDLILINEYER